MHCTGKLLGPGNFPFPTVRQRLLKASFLAGHHVTAGLGQVGDYRSRV
jgi:hypothetical protein